MFFKQIKHHGDNFSYIIADETAKKAAIIDPSYNADILTKTCESQGLTVEYVINTHGHGDHTAGNDEIRKWFNAKVVAHRLSTTRKDIAVADGDTIKVGNLSVKVIHTPGHTLDSICLLVDGRLLTGDTLFVGECGRTDLPGSSAEALYHSLFGKLMKLDDSVEIYPGHDYGTAPVSTIGRERETNYVLEPRILKEFLEFMSLP